MDGAIQAQTAFQAAVKALDAEAAGKALRASLPPRLRSSLREVVSADFELLGYEQAKLIDADDARSAIAMLDTLDRAGTIKDVIAAISGCLSVTKSRERDGLDAKMMISTLLDGLEEFPVDIVVTAFRRYQNANPFWPALAEIRQRCHEEHRWRRSLRRVCEQALHSPAPSVPPAAATRGSDWNSLSEASKANIDDILAKTKAMLRDGGSSIRSASKPPSAQQHDDPPVVAAAGR